MQISLAPMTAGGRLKLSKVSIPRGQQWGAVILLLAPALLAH
jgi:hypothetical protein